MVVKWLAFLLPALWLFGGAWTAQARTVWIMCYAPTAAHVSDKVLFLTDAFSHETGNATIYVEVRDMLDYTDGFRAFVEAEYNIAISETGSVCSSFADRQSALDAIDAMKNPGGERSANFRGYETGWFPGKAVQEETETAAASGADGGAGSTDAQSRWAMCWAAPDGDITDRNNPHYGRLFFSDVYPIDSVSGSASRQSAMYRHATSFRKQVEADYYGIAVQAVTGAACKDFPTKQSALDAMNDRIVSHRRSMPRAAGSRWALCTAFTRNAEAESKSLVFFSDIFPYPGEYVESVSAAHANEFYNSLSISNDNIDRSKMRCIGFDVKAKALAHMNRNIPLFLSLDTDSVMTGWAPQDSGEAGIDGHDAGPVKTGWQPAVEDHPLPSPVVPDVAPAETELDGPKPQANAWMWCRVAGPVPDDIDEERTVIVSDLFPVYWEGASARLAELRKARPNVQYGFTRIDPDETPRASEFAQYVEADMGFAGSEDFNQCYVWPDDAPESAGDKFSDFVETLSSSESFKRTDWKPTDNQ